ncbi:hypothetical protein V496_01302 [Pseudogymnoascus sp. VKM F-4515 (FW-2607)]|nr:hypothetical protein V496_01302 [Pseudogymnoascus sp. VKM F-4515 (FW-2607)]
MLLRKTNGDSPSWTNAPVPSPADLANAAAAWSDFETQVTTPTISSSMEIDLEDSTRKRQAQPDLTNPSKRSRGHRL